MNPPDEGEPAGRARIRLADIRAHFRMRETPRVLSPAIQLGVARLDDLGEVVVKLIQLLVGVLVLLLLLVIPHSLDQGFIGSPPFMVIAVYLAINVLGLLWALRPPVPDLAVYASILADFTLLYALIWHSHIQFDQPPAFVLKIPTMLYVFLFIAIRMLRFELRFVIAAGTVAAAGWAGLLGWVLWTSPRELTVTRDFATYLTSNSVLIGAEVDKILVIALVTGVLALSLLFARQLLVFAMVEAQAAMNLARFFDPDVASDIRALDAATSPGQGAEREATILFADLRGFTGIAAGRPANDVMAALGEMQKVIVPIIRAHGGTIDKFMGDGIMATFGAVRPLPAHAANALMAAEAVLESFSENLASRGDGWFRPDGIGVAVATGPVVAGAVGVEGRMEFTVIGAAVNLCAKLEKHNKEIGSLGLTTAETLRLARRQGFKGRRRYPSLITHLAGTPGETNVVVLRARRDSRLSALRLVKQAGEAARASIGFGRPAG